ncbi:MAG: hypothetical protein JWP10_668 [Nocardioidaceae bacterium]|nr:hypothetical protein [Nocardioidaceae bacterium]
MRSFGGNFRRFVTEVTSMRAARKHLERRDVPEGQRFDVVLPFSEHTANLYQIRQWLRPLEKLGEHYRVAIVCRDMSVFEILKHETSVQVLLMSDAHEVWSSRVGTKVFLYPNQDHRNLKMFGDDAAPHVFISHGESDKIYMYSNLVKSFTRYFVAGEVARARLARHLLNYDVEQRTLLIGRPQIDYLPAPRVLTNSERIVVLYAPTWEGLRPAMRYGSGPTHGVAIMTALLADPRFSVIYRPHPLTGTQELSYARADAEIRTLIENAAAANPAAAHLIDLEALGWQLRTAHVMISDISAVAYDWLPLAKPLILTKPAEPEAAVDASLLIDSVRAIAADEAADVVAVIDEQLNDPASRATLMRLAAAYYGDTSPGASTERFIAAVHTLVDERDAWVAEHPDALTPRRTPRKVRPLRDLLSFSAGKLLDGLIGRRIAASHIGRAEGRGGAEFMVVFPTGLGRIKRLLRWRSTIAELSRRSSVVVVVHDTAVYAALRLLRFPHLYLWQGSGAPDKLVSAFDTKVMIYVEQSERNLRETAVHDVMHVFLGRSEDPHVWGSNRLRVFDFVLTSDAEMPMWMKANVLDFSSDRKFIVVDEKHYPDELIAIIAERDREIAEREKSWARRLEAE